MKTYVNYYDVLNLSTDIIHDSNYDEKLHQAYLKESHRFHPDKCENGIEQFHLINEAYEVLKDPLMREEYHNSIEFKLDEQSEPSNPRQDFQRYLDSLPEETNTSIELSDIFKLKVEVEIETDDFDTRLQDYRSMLETSKNEDQVFLESKYEKESVIQPHELEQYLQRRNDDQEEEEFNMDLVMPYDCES